MRIRFLVSIAGADCAFDAGQEVDLPDDAARRWLQSGVHAEPVEPEPAVAPSPKSRKR